MSNINELADIVEMILQHILVIPPETFEAISTKDTFALTGRSSASSLLRCSKLWYHIGIPLLYEAVILRTDDQADSLAAAIRRTPALGGRIRRLRFEGVTRLGTTSSLTQIIFAAAHIHTLCLSLNMMPTTSVKGLCSALRMIRPSVLLIHDSGGYRGLNVRTVTERINACILQQKCLKRIILTGDWLDEGTVLALQHLPSLEYLSVDRPIVYGWPERIQAIAQNAALREIYCRCPPVESLIAGPGTRIRFEIPAKLDGGKSTNIEDVEKVISHEKLCDEIWARILGFATHLHSPDHYYFGSELHSLSLDHGINAIRRKFSELGNRRFQRLSLPCLFSIPLIKDDTCAFKFVRRIQSSPKLADLVHVLYVPVDHVSLKPVCAVPFPFLARANSGICILPHIPKNSALLSLSQDVSHVARGRTLFIAPSLFESFGRLHSLRLTGGSVKHTRNNVAVDALPNLEVLDIGTGKGMIPLFTQMRLPSLRSVHKLGGDSDAVVSFLEAHGDKLVTLGIECNVGLGMRVIDHCPNLIELSLYDDDPPPVLTLITKPRKQTALKRIKFPTSNVQLRARLETKKRWDVFFEEIDLYGFPSLQYLYLPESFSWPSTMAAAQKSVWITRMRLLKEKYGVLIVDSKGTIWHRT